MACCCDSNPRCQRVNRWVMYGLNILAWIFSVSTLASCTFIVDDDDYYSSQYGWGLFSGGYDGDCENYDIVGEAEGSHTAARAFGIMANLSLVLAFVASSLVLFLLRDKWAKICWNVARAFYSCALLFVMLTFVFLENFDCSEYDCILGAAGALNAVNVIILIVILCMGCCTPVPDEPLCKRGGGGGASNTGGQPAENKEVPMVAANVSREVPNNATPQITRTVQVLPNGQRKITEEKMYPDGTKEVTEWTEGAEVESQTAQTAQTAKLTSVGGEPGEEVSTLGDSVVPAESSNVSYGDSLISRITDNSPAQSAGTASGGDDLISRIAAASQGSNPARVAKDPSVIKE